MSNLASTNNPIDQLAVLLRQAKAKTRVQELDRLIKEAADRLREAQARAATAERRDREERPAAARALEQVEVDQHRLKILTQETAQAHALLDDEQKRQATLLIEASRGQIEARRVEARSTLEALRRELDEARGAVRPALERYKSLRDEQEQYQAAPDGAYAEADRLAAAAEGHVPELQVRAFAREIEDSAEPFGQLDRREQFAQLKIWVGRLRRFQAGEAIDDDRELLDTTYRRLVSLSKRHYPGYIAEFNRDYEPRDWDEYIADAQEELRLATEEVSRQRDEARRRQELQARDHERRQQARVTALDAMVELKAVVAKHHLPDEGRDEFLATLKRVVDGYGPPDDELLDLVSPYRELLVGTEYRNLRKHFDQNEADAARRRASDELREQFRDLIAQTRGLTALMIGGDEREDRRRHLEQLFEFEELEWVGYMDNHPAKLESLQQRVGNRSVDLVILMINFAGHELTGVFRPLCKKVGLPCATVEHGYGANRVAEALRRVLPRPGEEPRDADDDSEPEDD